MKKTSRICASIMLVVAIGFVLCALNHPESSLPWSNTISYILFGVYILIMVILFVAPFKGKRMNKMK